MIQKGHHLGPPRQHSTQLNQFNKLYQYQQRIYPSYQKEDKTKNSRLRSQIVNPQSIEKVPSTNQQINAKEILTRLNQNYENNSNSQMIILNDRKFIKNRTPDRYISPENFYIENKQEIDPWVKIKLLENRIVQLNRQKQMEMINLVNKNIHIQKQLQNQRQKSHILLNNTNSWIQTSKIATNENNNYPTNIQTQTLYRIIQQLQQSLQKITRQNKSLMSKNKNISEQIETFVKILITQKQIQNQNLSNRSKYVQDKSALESRIRSLDQQNKSYKSQIQYMQRQNMRIREQYKDKQSQLQNINTKTLQQNDKLHKKCIQLQQKLNRQQNKNTNLQQKIRKNDEKQKQSSYRNRQLILIKQVQDGSFLKINSTISQKQYPHQLTEDNLSNIIQKMQILTHNNDSIVQQNYMLRNKINQLIKENTHLKNIVQFANEKRLSKQFLDAKKDQNNLHISQGSIPNMNQNNLKSMLQQKNFSLELSAATINPKKKQQNCPKCKELVQLLFRLRNQIGLKSCVEKKTW